jgi:DNA-binding NtrC family response regulator
MSAATGHQATVLIISADPAARGSWARALETQRHAVITAATIDVAVGHSREGGIDAVVFDASDREHEGRALMTALDRLPEPPPVVLVSSSQRGPELSAHLGAAAFLAKPCTADDIVAECQRLLGSRTWRDPGADRGPDPLGE